MPLAERFQSAVTLMTTAKWLVVWAHFRQLLSITWKFRYALYMLIFKKKSYSEFTDYEGDQWATVHVYSLSLIFKLWSLPHYRSPSFQQDMIDNLQNVAIPGTGIPLSIFCYSYWICLGYILVCNPWVCFLGAINKARNPYTGTNATSATNTSINSSTSNGRWETLEDWMELVCRYYEQHLLHPDDWFSFWRMNCRLVSYHSALTSHKDYLLEDKWTFLTEGEALDVPVSPFYSRDVETLVCKNKNIEGGMGIFFYHNAACGGDWILQEKLGNCDWLSDLLPPRAPLSTMRVITTSTYSLGQAAADATGSTAAADAHKYVRAESGLLRLGRANASTDHSSVLFDVDIATGNILQGTSNAHWYKLGLFQGIFRCPWLPPKDTVRHHPDAPCPEVSGKQIPLMQEALKIVIESHYKMMPNVPIVGWDVAFTPKGIFLLEVNLSCNFFKGTFNIPRYIDFVDRYWRHLQLLEQRQVQLGGGSGGGGQLTGYQCAPVVVEVQQGQGGTGAGVQGQRHPNTGTASSSNNPGAVTATGIVGAGAHAISAASGENAPMSTIAPTSSTVAGTSIGNTSAAASSGSTLMFDETAGVSSSNTAKNMSVNSRKTTKNA